MVVQLILLHVCPSVVLARLIEISVYRSFTCPKRLSIWSMYVPMSGQNELAKEMLSRTLLQTTNRAFLSWSCTTFT